MSKKEQMRWWERCKGEGVGEWEWRDEGVRNIEWEDGRSKENIIIPKNILYLFWLDLLEVYS